MLSKSKCLSNDSFSHTFKLNKMKVSPVFFLLVLCCFVALFSCTDADGNVRVKRDPVKPSECEKRCKENKKHKAYYDCVVQNCGYNPV